MKKLTRIKLVNWHRFQNDIISLDDSVLLSGENGAGKSTILDAIQFVITCSKNHFNKAAHEKGKRNLNSYIRCKTGREDKPYERTGQVTAHIALEFYDESRKQYFIIGTVIDSSAVEKEPNAAWYCIDGMQLQEKLFFHGNVPKNISMFRSTNKVKQFVMTAGEARKLLKNRFGRLDNKFFSLIPKAMAFKPIHDIKDFVYSYVLDEKKIDIQTLQENVRSYQELQRLLENVKVRIQRLDVILNKHEAIEGCIKKDRTYGYYLARATAELAGQSIGYLEQDIQKSELLVKDWERKQETCLSVKRSQQEMIDGLTVELNQDESYRLLHDLEAKEQGLKDHIKQAEIKKREFIKWVKVAMKQVDILLKENSETVLLQEYIKLLQNIESCDSHADAIMQINEVISYKKKRYQQVQEELAEIRVSLREQMQALREWNQKIADLEKKKLSYPQQVEFLRGKIKEQFAAVNRNVEPRILCELLQITDAKWQNAVEGYLNTQRFYLIVEPEDFDLALSVYDRLRADKGLYGVGLINVGKLDGYEEAPKGSLAEVVTSQSIWARRYINMTLGKVHRCNRVQELKNYPTAITPQCMKYQNHVVSAIAPSIYETPYIGGEAYKIQLEKCQEEKRKLLLQMKNKEEVQKQLNFIVEPLDTLCDMEVRHRLSVIEELKTYAQQINYCREQIKTVKKNSTFLQKQIRLQELKEELERIEEDVRLFDRKIGSIEEHIQETKKELELALGEQKEKQQILSEAIQKLQEDISICSKSYEREVQERSSLVKFKENFEGTRKRNWTTKEKIEQEMIEKMREYKTKHDFGAPDSLAGVLEFRAEYEKLLHSDLLTYEEKVYKAKNAAETEFREQFLSKLQENIKQAQSEFKELNNALKDIHFNKEQYEFKHEPGKNFVKYYKMIMDDFNVMEGASIFSGSFQENHREVIDELFEKLTRSDENSGKLLEEFVDYRTYMDYDIKITGEDGSYMFYSKVSQEKSGGETQTPFYITVVASFMQLYRNSIGGDAIGLVLFDEAFNNMDDERITGVLEFLTQGNLQVIIAAPPDKIQYIGPSVKKTLLVLRDNDTSFVEEFGHETI